MDQFLQSKEWAKFQEANGREAVTFDNAFGIVHKLPVVGTYLYFPRWPEIGIMNYESRINNVLDEAEKRNIGWVRVEPKNESLLAELKKVFGKNFVKAPHDMQPRENFVIDISKSEEELLAAMKPKTRYNIRLAEKKGVQVFIVQDEKYREDFFRLIDATARRQKILPHPRGYYEKMFTVFPETMLALFVAEYKRKVIATNLVMFFGDTATYLHGGTSDEYRETMAPALLQWEQIREAKRRGCHFYDFGGVQMQAVSDKLKTESSSWAGITRFKTGFSPNTIPTVFPGSYDIIFDAKKYWLYDRLRHLQSGLSILKKFLRR